MPNWKDLGYQSYEQYRKSYGWLKLVRVHITTNPKASCWICHKTKQLVLHHENYDHMGEEKLYQDIIVLCWSCHTLAHFFIVLFGIELFPVRLVPRTLIKRRLFLRALHELWNGKIKVGSWFLLQALVYGVSLQKVPVLQKIKKVAF